MNAKTAGHDAALAVFGLKTAVVKTDMKQYRRALQMMAGGPSAERYDFHGTGDMPGVVGSGAINGGARDLYNTGGDVYMSRGAPVTQYFYNSQEGKRHGGFAFPASHSKAQPLPDQEFNMNPYVSAPSVPLAGRGTVIPTSNAPEVQQAAGEAQRKFRMRRINDAPFRVAAQVAGGSTRPSQGVFRMRDLAKKLAPRR